MRSSTLSAAVLACAAIVTLCGCNKLRSRDQLNQGAMAYKSAKYSEAVEHFKQAIAYDPTYADARLYLATAYFAQWIPGAESPENNELAAKAREAFLQVIDADPKNTTALESLGAMAYNQAQSLPADQKLAKFDEAAQWFHKLSDADPNYKDGYYYLGVIAYNKIHPARMLARVNLHMRDEDPGPIKDKKVRDDLRAQYSTIIDDGMANLQKAIDIDKEYVDAMSYMNLLIREKADLLDSSDEYKKQIADADNWLQKALDTKKIIAARQPQGSQGIVEGEK